MSTRRPSTRCAPWAHGCTSARRRPARRRGHRRGVDGGAGGQPGVHRGDRARPAGAAPLRRPRLGDGRPPGGRRRRHPRQDHDDRAAHRGARAAGADPTYAIGADVAATGSNAGEGAGDLFVAEADESDGAFLHYAPYAAIVTNIEADHLDHWVTEEAYATAFDDFAATVDPAGFLVCCVDDAGAAALAARQRAHGLRVVTVSTRPGRGGRRARRRWPGVTLWAPGDHYLADALLALAAGRTLGYADAELASGIASFTGTRRRMERKGEAGGVRVYDSYAHHPTEITGDLAAARELAGDGRLLVAFQPHLVSRTRTFGTAMGEALGAADEVVVCDVYLAREDADPSVTGALVASAVPLPPEHVAFVPDLDDVAGRAGLPRASGRPGADPGGRQCHRGRPARPRAARRRSCVASAARPARTRRPTDDRPADRQGHQAQQTTVRTPAVAPALAGLALPPRARAGPGDRRRRDLRRVVLDVARRRGRSRSAGRRPSNPPTSAPARASTRASRWSASTWRQPSGGSARWPSSGPCR